MEWNRMPVATGRRSVGEISGSGGQLRTDSAGALKSFTLRLSKLSVARLCDLVQAHAPPTGYILTVTGEDMNRLRIISDPLPGYEQAAAAEYLRGDVARVTGSGRSCNIYLAAQGVPSFRQAMLASVGRCAEWVELRARVVHRREKGARSLLEFLPDVDVLGEQESRRLAETEARLAADILTDESFADWE
jgi:hypothetical protein